MRGYLHNKPTRYRYAIFYHCKDFSKKKNQKCRTNCTATRLSLIFLIHRQFNESFCRIVHELKELRDDFGPLSIVTVLIFFTFWKMTIVHFSVDQLEEIIIFLEVRPPKPHRMTTQMVEKESDEKE